MLRRAGGASGHLVRTVGLLLIAAGCRDELPAKARAAGARPQPGQTAPPPRSVVGKKVLLVHSYHAEYPWVATISEGVGSIFSGTGVELETFYMDTKRRTDEAWKVRAGEQARQKVEDWRPDVVIAVDDNAQQYFAMHYVGKAVPFVFCGVDADPAKYGYPASNITGIIERPHFRETLRLAGTLRPIRRIAVLSNNDETSVAAFGFMKEDRLDVEVVEWNLVNDFEEWKQAVTRYNGTVDAIVCRSYQNVKDRATGKRVEPAEVGRWTAENATVPTMAFHDFEIEDGLLVGVVKSGVEYGQKAAGYALAILQGTPVENLPITRAATGSKMINGVTARRLGISFEDDRAEGVRLVGG